ncbi:unnamed protein product [Cyprideis torosa]|uniref:Uncharacterized protein n=1 Tax=Cyprideis torosa TaxID=163714 RepID=A0A7R8WAE7_9CRUS|nr:unnamed protein product [Cyprideis torosa]CAG0885407.1 unnamed protein product [Cyprideis torosa]
MFTFCVLRRTSLKLFRRIEGYHCQPSIRHFTKVVEDSDQNTEVDLVFDDNAAFSHTPVMANEVTEFLCGQVESENVSPTFLDMTYGNGGHSKRILEAIPQAKIIALDRDPVSIQRARSHAELDQRILPILAKFSTATKALLEVGIDRSSLDGVIIDAGCSSMQLEDAARGFSVVRDGPLDMRMDGSASEVESLTAADVVRHAEEHHLPGGRIAILSFHSGEDTIVKRMLQGTDLFIPQGRNLPQWLKSSTLSWTTAEFLGTYVSSPWITNKKVIVPREEEIKENPRARSAKMRIAIRRDPQSEKHESSAFLSLPTKASDNTQSEAVR